ncbi:hypothetical protein HKX48_001144, partial [Thoreauomyces humboldtii]
AAITLAGIWARILDIPQDDEFISPSTSFLSLGAKSITVIRMVAAAKREGFTFAVADVYRDPSLAALSAQRK